MTGTCATGWQKGSWEVERPIGGRENKHSWALKLIPIVLLNHKTASEYKFMYIAVLLGDGG
jgi:hypothetical protein